MDQNKEPQKVPLAGEVPETKLPEQKVPVSPTIIDVGAAKDYSHLPVGVQTSLELDKKTIAPQQPLTEQKSTNNIVPKSVLKNDFSKKFFKITLIIFGIFSACFILFLLLSATNIDTQFIKITLNGTVTDGSTGEAVKDASILINGAEVGKTDSKGIYSVSNLSSGNVQITVKADGYDDQTEEVKISKVLLDYSTRKDFTLKSSITGVLSGKFIPNTKDYKFTNDQLLIGEKQYTIADDGSFNIPNVKVGEIKFTFNSINYKDIQQTINVVSGSNKIPDFTLTPSGDIIGELKSYVKEDLVLNTKFYVENILQDQVQITAEGKFAVKDLEPGKKYKIRVTADGYKTRDYEINITQGENQLFNFKLVEEGIAAYPIRVGDRSYDPVNLYTSDFDGQNPIKVTEDTSVDAKTKFYSIEDKILYFQSSGDTSFKRKSGGGNINIPYAYNLSTSVVDRLTVNTSNLDDIYPNFIAKKMLNIYSLPSDRYKFGLQVMGLDGNNRKTIKELTLQGVTFTNYKISNNGKAVVYGYKNAGQDELYIYNLDTDQSKSVLTGKDISVFDISEDGNLILAARRNPSTDLVDLVLINISADDLRTLKENYKGSGYQFIKGTNNKLVFFEARESRFNIYTFTIDRSQEERLTSLSPDYTINNIYQESNLLFYNTNKGLLVVDVNKPKNFKVVSSSALNKFE